MGKITGFMEYERLEEGYKPVAERLKHYKEFVVGLDDAQAKIQGARCMDCGTPFCNNGCPVNNIIPDFNDLVYQGDWENAIAVLHSTNNFPEFTGRICPAPCEAACTIYVNGDAVGIKSIEHAIIDKAWENGWVKPMPPKHKTGKKVAVVGTGATAVQIVPTIAPITEQVYVVQRTPSAVGVRNNCQTDPDWFFNQEPGWQQERMWNFTAMTSGLPLDEDMVGDAWTEVYRGEMANGGVDKTKLPDDQRLLADVEIMNRWRSRIEDIVEDKDTAEALKPWYDMWCKRPCFHDDYLPAFNRDNVKLLDTDGQGIEAVTPTGIVVQGKEYPVDIIVFATGFETGTMYKSRMHFELYGRDGKSLSEDWAEGTQAHTLHGLLSRGFPNAFLYSGAQGGFATSIVHSLQDHAEHVGEVVSALKERQATLIEPTPEAEEEWWNWIMTGFQYGYDQMKECTPSWLNGEGNRDPSRMKLSIYLGPLKHYSDKLREWRANGMPGVEIS